MGLPDFIQSPPDRVFCEQRMIKTVMRSLFGANRFGINWFRPLPSSYVAVRATRNGFLYVILTNVRTRNWGRKMQASQANQKVYKRLNDREVEKNDSAPAKPSLADEKVDSLRTLRNSLIGFAPNASKLAFSAIASTVMSARVHRPGANILLEGQPSDTIHLIVSGGMARYKTTMEGGRTIVWLGLPREFANLGLLWFDKVNYGMFALGQTRSLCLSASKLHHVLKEQPDIAVAFGWLISAENMMLGERVQSLARLSARERLLLFLCETGYRSHALEEETTGGLGDSFEIGVTQAQLADLLGLTPVHVNRTIQTLISEGMVARQQKKWRLLNPAAAWREANFSPNYLHPYKRTAEPQDAAASGRV